MIYYDPIFRFVSVIPMRWSSCDNVRHGQETGRIFLRGEPPFRETCDMRLGAGEKRMGDVLAPFLGQAILRVENIYIYTLWLFNIAMENHHS